MTYLLLSLLASAWAGDVHAQVLDLLSAYEEPVTSQALQALGDDAGAALWDIARDTSETTSHRTRAIGALGYFPTAERRAWLETQLTDDGVRSVFRRKAAYALALGWGDGAVSSLSGALAGDDVQLQIAAANALGQIGTDASRQALQARLPQETEPAVRSAIEGAL